MMPQRRRCRQPCRKLDTVSAVRDAESAVLDENPLKVSETPKLRDAREVERTGIADSHQLFRDELFLAQAGFRAETKLHFVNHHEAHGLAALFYTDWDDALIYTADGIGDNVSYSVRSLREGAECRLDHAMVLGL